VPQALLQKLAAWGVELDEEAIRPALVHASALSERPDLASNERLEFLGDSVLELAVAEHLYRTYPKRDEGDLSKLRGVVVSRPVLAEVGRALDMGEHLVLGRGEEQSGGRERSSIISAAVEAVMGVVFLHKGYETARRLAVEMCWPRRSSGPARNSRRITSPFCRSLGIDGTERPPCIGPWTRKGRSIARCSPWRRSSEGSGCWAGAGRRKRRNRRLPSGCTYSTMASERRGTKGDGLLVEKLEQHFQRQETARPRDYFYVSEVSKCPRQIYYSMKGLPRPPMDGVTARKLAVGDDAHRRVAQALFSMGVVVAAEVPMPSDALFHGRADVIVSLNGKNYVVEVKTAHPYSYEQMAVGPRGDHSLQLQLYLYHFGIPQGIILAENKATQELKEFLVELDRPQVERILEEFRILRELIVEQGKLPPLPDKSDWEFNQCRYCPYVEPCGDDVTASDAPGSAQSPRRARSAQPAQEEGTSTSEGLFGQLD